MQKPADRLPPLDLLVTFEAAARHLSFTRAGAERCVTQSAVSRQIRALEDDLGVALFRRRHRALGLTADGAKLLRSCDAALGALRATVGEIRAPTRREVLSLTTTPGFAALWLIPRLPAFARVHPGIDVRLDASFAPRDLRADGFDVAVRYAAATAAHGQALFRETLQPVCSPALLRAGPPLVRPGDLRRHTLLQATHDAGAGMPLEWDPWLQAVGLAGLQPASTLSLSTYDEAIAAALAGHGVAIGRRPIVDALLRKGDLVAPFAETTVPTRAFFLIVEPAARARPAVRALEAWLLAEAAGG